MQVLRKLSDFAGTATRPSPLLKHKESSYKPATRLEKIKEKSMIYPSSSQSRFVFISNMDGTGFQRETYLTCPTTIPLDDMVNKINVVCYKQWERSRDLNEKNPFGCLDLFTNWSMGMLIVLWLVLYVLTFKSNDFVSFYLYIFLVFIIASTVVSLVVYFQKAEDYDADLEMIRAIKRQLNEFNVAEREGTENRPAFEWSCHKECLWISLKLTHVIQESDI